MYTNLKLLKWWKIHLRLLTKITVSYCYFCASEYWVGRATVCMVHPSLLTQEIYSNVFNMVSRACHNKSVDPLWAWRIVILGWTCNHLLYESEPHLIEEKVLEKMCCRLLDGKGPML